MKYISLFSSAGIGTFGLKEDGHICVATNELLEERLYFQKLNNVCDEESGYINGDITRDSTKQKIYYQAKKHNDIDIIIATPPCQGISLLNLKKNNNDQYRNSLVVESLEIINKIKPKLFILENVSRFLETACLFKEKWISIKEAISNSLSKNYSIAFKKVNLKYIGSKSSRTRTIVVGLRRDISKHYSPWELMPKKIENISTLYEVIGDLPSLKWGEINSDDFYHAFREYDKRMLPWIKNLEPGQSAFDNEIDNLKPHRIINGKFIFNKNSTGDKYKRQFPDKVASCIMTRNDQLASQNTIHYKDNRVFSIRELMRLMTIPNNFKFFDLTNEEFQKLSRVTQKIYYKKHELNIRRTIGESVPTFLFRNIVRNFKSEEKKIKLNNKKELLNYITNNKLKITVDLKKHINRVSRISLNLLFEELEPSAKETGLYFTNPDIVTDLINSIEIKGTKVIEPSVGIGSFLIPMIKAFPEKDLKFTVYDINKNALIILRSMVDNKNIEFLNRDFLSHDNISSDLIIGNPPYVRINKNNNKYDINSSAKNLFELFIYKSKEVSKNVIFVLPKYILFNHKYSNLRIYLRNNGIYRFWDYKGMFFPNAKIETVVIGINGKQNKKFITNNCSFNINLLTNKNSSIFTIWPENELVKYGDKLRYFDNIKSTRLLKINNKFKHKKTGIKIFTSADLRGMSKNIFIKDNGEFEKEKNMVGIFVPNMTKAIKALKKPKNTLWNGSLALIQIPKKDYNLALETWNSKIFKSYINMLRSGAERSINIDKELIKHFGIEEN